VTVRVRDVAAAIFDGPHATPKTTSEGPLFLGISSLVDGRLELSRSRRLSEPDFLKWTRRVTPRAGDLVFSYETRIGQAALIPEGLRCCLGRRMGLIRPDTSKVDPRFLLYAYLGQPFQETLRERTVHGSTVDRILLTELPNLPITLPETLDEQRRIGSVLGALDDKIEPNRRMNRTLEALAEAVFLGWLRGMDPLEGEPPGGWTRSTLGDTCDQFGGEVRTGPFGSQLHASDYVPEGIPSVMPKDLKEDRVSTVGIARITEADAERLSRHRLRPGDIVCSRRGDVERRALVTEREAGWLCGTGSLRVRLATDAVDPHYLYRYFGHPSVRNWIVRHAQGATMPNLNSKILRALPFLLPPAAEQRVLASVIGPLFERREANHEQNESLAPLRDTLLPRLISGEIRVPEGGDNDEVAL